MTELEAALERSARCPRPQRRAAALLANPTVPAGRRARGERRTTRRCSRSRAADADDGVRRAGGARPAPRRRAVGTPLLRAPRAHCAGSARVFLLRALDRHVGDGLVTRVLAARRRAVARAGARDAARDRAAAPRRAGAARRRPDERLEAALELAARARRRARPGRRSARAALDARARAGQLRGDRARAAPARGARARRRAAAPTRRSTREVEALVARARRRQAAAGGRPARQRAAQPAARSRPRGSRATAG